MQQRNAVLFLTTFLILFVMNARKTPTATEEENKKASINVVLPEL